MDATELGRLFEARRYRDLAKELGSPSPDEELEVARLRARLAKVRWAPLLDVLEAARRLTEAGAPDAPRFTAQAIRGLARAGANERAKEELARAADRWPGEPAIALAREQLSQRELDADDETEHEVRLMLRRGDVASARARVEEVVAEREGRGRAWAATLLVDMARGARDFDVAARTFDQLRDDGPEAFDAPLLETCGALCRWAAGDVARALEALRSVRERTRGGHGEQATAYAWSADVLDRLDKDPEARDGGPTWIWAEGLGELAPRRGDMGASAGEVCLDRFGRADDARLEACPDMATLRYRLRERGLDSVRLVANPERIEAGLAEGAVVVLEEERSTRTGFLLVAGIEPVAGLLLIHDPERGGAYLTTFAEQRARATLFGGSGLLVLGRGEEASARGERLAERGAAHDARMDAIDACDLDGQGRVPPRARVDVLAREAIDVAPELPTPHRRHGEAMLDQLRAGRLGGGRLERWVAVTREKFPRAEWALQIYAQALEIWGRPHEAGIAWADAQALDDWDERNTYGRARAHLRLGEKDEAEALLRRTLSLAPGHAGAMARWASLRLERGDLDGARTLSELAEAIAPDDPAVLNTRATVLEEEDRFEEALARLRRVADANPRDTGTRARVLKRLFHAGRWDDAAPVADAMVAADPGDPFNWADLAFVRVATGDGAGATDALATALARCGPDRVLVDESARVLATLLDAAGRAAFAEVLERALAGAPLSLMDVAVELTRRKLDEEGIRLALRAKELLSRDPNGPWRAAQTLIAIPEERAARFARIEELLRETIAMAERYPHPRVVLALHTHADDPEGALELLREADVRSGPVLVWKALSVLHGAAGQEDERARVDERLLDVGADALLDAATFLRNVGLAPVALELFDAALERAPGSPRARFEKARTLLREGDAASAARALGDAPGGDPFVETLIAIANRDWERVVQVAAPEVQRVTRRSAGGAYDGWVMRARLAGAQLALGDAAGAERLRTLAGRHPDALAALVQIGRAASLEQIAADAERLAATAPGAMLTVERGGARW